MIIRRSNIVKTESSKTPAYRAVAWIERSNGEARVVVIDGVGDRVAPLPLALPAVAADDRVFWAGQQRIHIGPALLAPRAVATWNE